MDSSPEITAQNEYKRIVSTYVAPVMKAHGYKRTRTTWQRTTENSRLVLYAQPCPPWRSTSLQMSFTASLRVVSLAVHRLLGRELNDHFELTLRDTPPSWWRVAPCIGDLMPHPRETWWYIDLVNSPPSAPEAGEIRGDPDTIGADFAAAIEQFAIPFLAQVDHPAGLLDAIDRVGPRMPAVPWARDSLVLIVQGPAAFRRHWQTAGAAYEKSELLIWRRVGAHLLNVCSQMES
jgi:hypothetical protein